jgi:hypothetical protein
VAVEYVPAVQAEQAVVLAEETKVPAGQEAQTEEPAEAVKEPAAQDWQALLAGIPVPVLNWPEEHATQLAEESWASPVLYVPAGQPAQSAGLE